MGACLLLVYPHVTVLITIDTYRMVVCDETTCTCWLIDNLKVMKTQCTCTCPFSSIFYTSVSLEDCKVSGTSSVASMKIEPVLSFCV